MPSSSAEEEGGPRHAYATVMGSGTIVRRLTAAEDVFTNIYANNAWGGRDSLSGTGSDCHQTRIISREIPTLLSELGATTMLDIPCGDFHWMSRVDLGDVDYTGADIVDELIRKNRVRSTSRRIHFRRLNLLSDRLPSVDLILCRDCLVHLPFSDVFMALNNVCRSGATYLLTTSFPERTENRDISMGDWRPLNMERAPFFLPPPLRYINEGCTEGDGYFADKSLGLWRVDDVRRLTLSAV